MSDIELVILNLVNKLHNITRSAQGLSGSLAFNDIIKLLMLKFIEPMLLKNEKLYFMNNLENYELLSNFNPDDINLLQFSNLINNTDEDVFHKNIYKVWDMLSVNKFTKDIFPSGKTFNMNIDVLIKCCVKIHVTMKNIKFDNLTNDIKGLIYEKFVNGYSLFTGKELGQFFTPRKLINVIFQINSKYINKVNFDDLTLYDPCMGTGGFLTEVYKKYKLNSENIYGGELEPNTYAIGLMNLLLTTGSICNLQQIDSLTNLNNLQFDLIFTNPPFGIKDIVYNDLIKKLTLQNKTNNLTTNLDPKLVYNIQTNDASALFLQHCISKLKNKGFCSIVMPDGCLWYNKQFLKFRQYFIENCNVKAVLYSNNVFEHTSISVITLFFTKSKKYHTKSIDFYETKIDELNNLIYEKINVVTYDQLKKNNFILVSKLYKPIIITDLAVLDDTTALNLSNKTEIINNIIEIEKNNNKSKHTVKNAKQSGKYKLIRSSTLGKISYLDSYDYEGPNIVLGTGGNANVHLCEKFSTTQDCKVFKIKNSNFLIEFIYIYLINNLELLDGMFLGLGLKHISMESFYNLEIPIKTIEEQKIIINEYYKFIDEIKKIEISTIQLINNNKQKIKNLFLPT
jgi:type I restriction-modification system DNA methylase subunit